SLPAGGYRALHPVQRARVVEELLNAVQGDAIGISPTLRPTVVAPRAVSQAAHRASKPRRASPTTTVRGTLASPLSLLTGRRRTLEGRLARMGVRTVSDLLYLFPRRYDDYSSIRPIAELTH